MEIEECSKKFIDNEINRKKISALINFSETLDDFTDWLAIEYLACWLSQEGLDGEGMRFLDHLLCKWGINYLDWSCRTLWVKAQIASRRSDQLAFVFDDLEKDRIEDWKSGPFPSFAQRHKMVPLALVNKNGSSRGGRKALC